MAAKSLIEAFCDEFSATPPLDRVGRDILRSIANRSELAYYPAGTTIYHADEMVTHLFLIKDGRVGSHHSDHEVHEYSRGDVFPIGVLLTGQKPDAAMEALEDSFIYILPADVLDTLRQSSSAFADYCLDRIGHLLVRSRQQLQATLALDSRHAALNMTLAQIMSQPVTCLPTATLRSALEKMQENRVGSMLVADQHGMACGIYTLQDLLHTTLSSHNLDTPISAHMRGPLLGLSPEALATDAAVLMARHCIRHVPVLDQGRLLGMVSERDLYGLQRVSLGSIERLLERAETPDDFREVTAQIRTLSINLLAQGLAAEPLARLISTLFDRLTTYILIQKLEPIRREGLQICWLVFGSEGRQEQTFSTDQDNGIIFFPAREQTAEAIRARLLPICAEINHMLDHCGITLCKGGIMAMNPACCLSLPEWESRFAHWIDEGNPQSLLAATIYFDLRPIWGDESLAESLHATLQKRIQERPRFLWLLTRNALLHEPPLGRLREFVTQKHNGVSVVDLKAAGTVFFVDAARILALQANVRVSATSERLRQAGEQLNIPRKKIESWLNAFQFLQMLRLRYQEEQISRGEAPDNLIDPDKLTALDRRILYEALGEARWIQRHIERRWPA